MSQTPATRQELLKLKKKTKMAKRGWSLLKDKRDGLMRKFMETIHEAIELRRDFDEKYQDAYADFIQASLTLDDRYIQTLAETTSTEMRIHDSSKSIMGVKVKALEAQVHGDYLNHSMVDTNTKLDTSLEKLKLLLPDLLRLVEKEHTASLLAREIEITRRRVNSLEYVVIPQMQSQVKQIWSKLEEQARSTTISLMKVKQQILNKV